MTGRDCDQDGLERDSFARARISNTFPSSSAIVGRPLRLDDQPVTVVGVVPDVGVASM